MSTIYMFPGQGSQTKGMGEELFDKYRSHIKTADEILGYSLKTLCLEDPDNQLNLTQFTQPALFTVTSLMYLDKLEESDTKPNFVAGHSLGEYTALFAAGAFDFETGVKLVRKRGELMGKAAGGGMAAVIGLGREQVQDVLAKSGIETIDVANFNSPTQTILSGPKDDLTAAKPHFEEGGAKRYLPLKVSAAFHSRYMEEAAADFERFISTIELGDPELPVIANVTAQPYKPGEIRDNLTKQITHSVRWQESIQYLMDQPDPQFEEIGPGNVLTKLVQQIQKG